MTVILPTLPNGRAIFCEDIRAEVNGKVSLMGIFTGAMFFPNNTQFPISLPKFCIAVFWHEPFENHADELTFRTTYVEENADPLGNDGILLAEARHDLREMKDPSLPPNALSIYHVRMLTSYMTIAPFIIPHPGRLRVRAFRGTEVIAVGALRVENFPS